MSQQRAAHLSISLTVQWISNSSMSVFAPKIHYNHYWVLAAAAAAVWLFSVWYSIDYFSNKPTYSFFSHTELSRWGSFNFAGIRNFCIWQLWLFYLFCRFNVDWTLTSQYLFCFRTKLNFHNRAWFVCGELGDKGRKWGCKMYCSCIGEVLTLCI